MIYNFFNISILFEPKRYKIPKLGVSLPGKPFMNNLVLAPAESSIHIYICMTGASPKSKNDRSFCIVMVNYHKNIPQVSLGIVCCLIFDSCIFNSATWEFNSVECIEKVESRLSIRTNAPKLDLSWNCRSLSFVMLSMIGWDIAHSRLSRMFSFHRTLQVIWFKHKWGDKC